MIPDDHKTNNITNLRNIYFLCGTFCNPDFQTGWQTYISEWGLEWGKTVVQYSMHFLGQGTSNNISGNNGYSHNIKCALSLVSTIKCNYAIMHDILRLYHNDYMKYIMAFWERHAIFN